MTADDYTNPKAFGIEVEEVHEDNLSDEDRLLMEQYLQQNPNKPTAWPVRRYQ